MSCDPCSRSTHARATVGQSHDQRLLPVRDPAEDVILLSPCMIADFMPGFLTAVLRQMAQERSVALNALLRQVTTGWS